MEMDRLHLIAEVFSRPALWDLQCEEYKTRTGISAYWKEVATKMGPDATVDGCKRKWKNLRDAYRAEIKRIELRIERDLLKGTYDPKNVYTSKWAYFEHLKFLKDIKRPRRRNIGELKVSSSDKYDDDTDDLEQFSELHDIDNIKSEPDEINTTYMLDKDYNGNDDQNCNENPLREVERPPSIQMEDSTQSSMATKLNPIKSQNDINDQPSATQCRCPKRSYDQVNFLDCSEREEQNVTKLTRLGLRRSSNFAYVGDPDYNFLISFLPQIKKMNELQNLRFRAKMSDFMYNIMSQSVTNNIASI